MCTGIHDCMLHWLNGYIVSKELRGADYISAPALGASAGIKGALSMAISADYVLRRS
jgi:hypothetical protein